MCLAPHCECNGRGATCQRHRPLYVTHPRFPPPPSRRCCCPLAPAPPFPARSRFCHCRLLAPPTPRCKGPCLPVPGPIPRAGSLRIALLAVASRRARRCFRCLSRQLTPLPPLLRHRASCRCTHCNSARRQPSCSQTLRICSCLPLCRSLPTRRRRLALLQPPSLCPPPRLAPASAALPSLSKSVSLDTRTAAFAPPLQALRSPSCVIASALSCPSPLRFLPLLLVPPPPAARLCRCFWSLTR